MARFYANWTGRGDGSVGAAADAPLSRSEALREASLWLRDYALQDGSQPFRHPIYWAAFALSGAD